MAENETISGDVESVSKVLLHLRSVGEAPALKKNKFKLNKKKYKKRNKMGI